MRKNNADRLLSNYLIWGLLSVSLFIVFIGVLVFAVMLEQPNILLYFVLLLTGFLWIGATSVTRHEFVLVKRYIGKDINVLEFLLTQFIVVLFPFYYMKLRKEVLSYREKEAKADSAEGEK